MIKQISKRQADWLSLSVSAVQNIRNTSNRRSLPSVITGGMRFFHPYARGRYRVKHYFPFLSPRTKIRDREIDGEERSGGSAAALCAANKAQTVFS